LLIMPSLSGYGPAVSDAVVTQPVADVPLPPLDPLVVGDAGEEHPASAAPTPAPSAASTSRRPTRFRSLSVMNSPHV
jgi:hypothetical protein